MESITIASILGVLVLLFIILWFRYLTRRRKYDVMEKAIMNNYPLSDLTLNDSKYNTIYVPQPVMPSAGANPSTAPAQAPMTMTAMPNWRALMPAVKWMAWGLAFLLFGLIEGEINPFLPLGLALMFVGVCKGYIMHKEQKMLQDAWDRNAPNRQSEAMREGIPVPPPVSGYNNDVSAND